MEVWSRQTFTLSGSPVTKNEGVLTVVLLQYEVVVMSTLGMDWFHSVDLTPYIFSLR